MRVANTSDHNENGRSDSKREGFCAAAIQLQLDTRRLQPFHLAKDVPVQRNLSWKLIRGNAVALKNAKHQWLPSHKKQNGLQHEVRIWLTYEFRDARGGQGNDQDHDRGHSPANDDDARPFQAGRGESSNPWG